MRAAALLCVMLAPLSAPALSPRAAPTQYRQQWWGREQGLPHSSVQALAQTPDGYLWVGTGAGLARFDGVRFVVSELDHVDVHALTVTPDGVMWIGTREGELYRYQDGRFRRLAVLRGWIRQVRRAADGRIWVASYEGGLFEIVGEVAIDRSDELGLVSRLVFAVSDDKFGNLWVATMYGLHRIHDGRTTVVTQRDGISDDRIFSLFAAPTGDLWIGTAGGGLVRLHEGAFTALRQRDGLAADAVTTLLGDRDGNLWVGTRAGLNRLHQGVLTRAPEIQPNPTVSVLFEDREGNLWVGRQGGGLYRFADVRALPFGKPEGFPDGVVWAVLHARDGSLWVGAEVGLFHFAGGRMETRPDHPRSPVKALFEDRAGRLWVGTSDELLRYDGRRWEREAGIEGPSAFAEDRAGNLWIGSGGGGLIRRASDGAHTHYRQADGLSSDLVTALHVAGDGTLFIGTESGLDKLRDGKLSPVAGAGKRAISAFLEDADGTLWIAAEEGPLLRMRGEVFTRFTRKQGLCSDSSAVLLDDGAGNLWLNDDGPFRVRRSELEELAAGRRQQVSCRVLASADGLRSSEAAFGFPAGARAGDGSLWFGMSEGVVRVDPAQVERPAAPPPVVIEDVVLDGAGNKLEVRYTAPSLRAPERVRFRYRLDGFDRDWVDAGGRRVAFYTNLPPGDYRFRVTAAAEEGSWNPTGAARGLRVEPRFFQTAWFAALCVLAASAVIAGGFRLRVSRLKARQRELETLVQTRTESLEQANLGLKRAQAQLIHSERMSALGQLVAGVAHELNNPVNFISSNIDFLEERHTQLLTLIATLEQHVADTRAVDDCKREIDFDFLVEDAPELLKAFRHGAERITAIVNSLRLFSRGGDSGFLEVDLREGLEASLRLLAPVVRQLKVHLDLQSLPKVRCSPGRINQVFMNLIINAAQAMGESGELFISGRADGEMVELRFRDTGPGVPVDLRQRIFEPFFTTRPVGQGVGLGLSISFGIVADHGGTIEAGGDHGAELLLRLPIRT